MCFYCEQPLPVSRINWQILSREQSKQPAEAAQVQCLLAKTWLAFPCTFLLSQSRWGACVCPCMHVSTWLLMCVFPQKARGSWNRLHGATHIGLLLPTKASSGTAELPFASIVLIGDQAGEAQRPTPFFPQSKLSPPVLWSKHKPPRWKQQCRCICCSNSHFFPLQSISTHQRKKCSLSSPLTVHMSVIFWLNVPLSGQH